jgi:hypothetical protein
MSGSPIGPLFSPDATVKAVHDSLDAALAAIPDGHSHAVLFDGTITGAPTVRAVYL